MQEMETKKRALGMGLEQLFNNERLDINQLERDIVSTTEQKDILELPLNEIRSNPYQPRKHFDDAALKELAESIKENGVIQPIIVKKSIKGYELIAGERRCKASRLAGKETIPAIIKEFSDEQMMEIALLENIQRENLSPIEEAEAYLQIIRKTGQTQDEVGRKFGKNRSYITNMLGLLRLPDNVKEKVNNRTISMSHAKILSKLESVNQIEELAERIEKEGLSVHDLESILMDTDAPKLVKVNKPKIPSRYGIYENTLKEKLGIKLKVKNNKIEIPFKTKDELDNILDVLNVKMDD